MIYEHFSIEAVQCVSGPFEIHIYICLQNDDVQDFDTRLDQVLLAASEIFTEMVMEGLYKLKLQEFCGTREKSKRRTTELFQIEDISKTSY